MSNDPDGKFPRRVTTVVGEWMGKPGNVILHTGGTERIRVEANGDVFVEGRKAGTDKEVFRGLQRVLGLATVHVLQHGKSLCDISVLHGLPGSWPPGNVWVSVADVDQTTCEGCLTAYGLHSKAVTKLVLEDTADKDRLTFTRGVITRLLSFLKEHQNDSHRMSVVHVTEVLQSLATALEPPSKPVTLDSILGTSPKPFQAEIAKLPVNP